MTKNPLRILALTENPLIESGFAAQARGVFKALHEAGHELHVASWVLTHQNKIKYDPNIKLDYEGKPIIENPQGKSASEVRVLPYHTYPLSLNNYWGAELIPDYVREVRPDVIFVYGDPHMLGERGLGIHTIAEKAGVPLVAYIAVDCAGHQDWVGKNMLRTDYPVLFTEWAQAQLETEFPELKGHLRNIPHGLKEVRMIPQQSKKALRKLFNLNRKGTIRKLQDNEKILLTVARNCERKAFDRLLRGYVKLKEQRQDWVAILHTQPKDNSADSLDLEHLVQKVYGLGDFVFFSRIPNPAHVQGKFSVADWEYLQNLYGSADLFVLPSKREGFGLPVTEAGLAGVASVVTDYASLAELVDNNRGWTVKVADYDVQNPFNHIAALVDPEDLANTISYALDNPKERLVKASNMRKWCIEELNWETVGQQWVDLFEEVANNLAERGRIQIIVSPPDAKDVTWYTDFRHLNESKTQVAMRTIAEMEKQGTFVEKADFVMLTNPHDNYPRNNIAVLQDVGFKIVGDEHPSRIFDLLEQRHREVVLFEKIDVDAVPPSVVDIYNNPMFKAILVPSQHMRSVLEDSGVTTPVYDVGSGVRISDPSNKFDFLQDQKKTKFLMFADEHYKLKGLDLMLQVASAFPKEAVCLLKTSEEGIELDGVNVPVHQIDEFLSEADLSSLFYNSDIFLSFHRASGFERPVLEALAHGVPTVTCDYGAVKELANHIITVPTLSMERVFSETDIQQGKGIITDIEKGVQIVKDVISNIDHHKKMFRDKALEVQEQWSWERTADRVIKAIKSPMGTVPVPSLTQTRGILPFPIPENA